MRRRDEAAKSRSLCWRRKRWSAKPVMTIFTAIKACAISSQRVAASGATCAIMSRRGRNDILPLAIAQHPQLTTDNSALPPLEKIALKSTPDWQVIWMKRCVHDLPPTYPVSRRHQSLGLGRWLVTMVLNELKTPGATPFEKRSAHPSSRWLSGPTSLISAQQHRQLRDVGGDVPRVVAREEFRAPRRPSLSSK